MCSSSTIITVKIIISSNIKYYKVTLPPLLQSLKSCGVSNSSIVVSIGGSPNEFKEVRNSLTYFYVQHNSIDFTGLITIIEKELESDYWFVLHDTSYVGSNFWKRVINIPKVETISLKRGLSMNIGAYHTNFIFENKDAILQTRNYDLSEEAVQRMKSWGVLNEDYVINLSKNKAVYGNGEEGRLIREDDFYKSGVIRRIEYYRQIDLYKIKANWHIKNKYEVRP